MKRIKSVDALRVFLLLIIFTSHAWILGDSPVRTLVGRATGYALELFFILSGCFVAIKYSGKEIRARSFVFHEFFKFYPELVLAHLLSLSYKIGSSMFKGTSIDWVDYLKKSVINLSLLQSWFPTEEYVFAFNGVGWFLSSLFFCCSNFFLLFCSLISVSRFFSVLFFSCAIFVFSLFISLSSLLYVFILSL